MSKTLAAIPAASQAVCSGPWVFISGQLPGLSESETSVASDTEQILQRLADIAQAAGGSLDHLVKITVYLTDLYSLADVDAVLLQQLQSPLPAKTVVPVPFLPGRSQVQIDAIMCISEPPWALAVT